MIADFFLGLAAAVLGKALDALPTVPAEDYSGLSLLVSQALGLNKYLPIAELLTCVSVVLSFNTARLAFFFLGWVYQRIPFKAS